MIIFYDYINIKQWTIEEHCNICHEKARNDINLLANSICDAQKGISTQKKFFVKHLSIRFVNDYKIFAVI